MFVKYQYKFYSNSVLGSFCIECVRLSSDVQVLPDGTTVNRQQTTIEELESASALTKAVDHP